MKTAKEVLKELDECKDERIREIILEQWEIEIRMDTAKKTSDAHIRIMNEVFNPQSK